MIHQFKSLGLNIVMDVESGAIHIVDDLVFDLIPLVEENMDLTVDEAKAATDGKYNEDALREGLEEIRELKENGTLFSPDTYEGYVDSFIKGKEKNPIIKAMCLHAAHDCNLRCTYCFASKGEYHGDRALLSYETGKAALDFLMDHSGNRVNLEVDFFGGEPTLNFDVVKRLVEYGRSKEKERNKRFRFTLTTNGVLLDDEILSFANKEMGNLVLSIDGRKEIHDRMRPDLGGKGSYDRVVERFLKAAESRGQQNYYVRGTYTHYNTDFSKDVLHLNDLGFEQVSVEPVVCDPKEDYALKESDLPVLLEQYDILAEEILKRRKNGKFINFFHFMIDLEGGPCIAKRLSGCGSGVEYIAVTPFGEIYPCHQFVGEEKFLMGDVFSGIKKTEMISEFARCNVYSKPECRECFAKFYCSGGCSANSYHATGNINGNYSFGCELQRKRTECAIALKAALMEEGIK